MFNNQGLNTFTPQGNNNSVGGVFGAKPNSLAGIFGGNNQGQQNTGGVFGANTGINNGNTFGNTQPNTLGQPNQALGGVFGNNQGNNTFGNTQGGSNFSVFGNNNQQQTQTQGQGMFGTGQNTQGVGIFNDSQQAQQNNGGVFGNQQNNNTLGGVFGQTQQTTPGIFGNNQQRNGTGIFGGGNQGTQNNGIFNNNQPQTGNSVFGNTQGNTGGVFGAVSNNVNNSFLGNNNNTPAPFANNTPTNNIFGGNGGNTNNNGNNIFGGNNNNGGNNVFAGGNNGGNNNIFGGITGANNTVFGGATNNTNGNNIFAGNNNINNNNGNNIFGGNNNANNTNVFGNNNAQQTTNPVGLFNTFAPNNNNTNQQPNNFLGSPQTNTNLGASPIFGNNNNNNSFNNANTNKLGGTTWGVPTLNNTPSLGNTLGAVGAVGGVAPAVGAMGGQSLQPVKSKNSKLDAKHLIKCISALDQFSGLCKEQIRMNYIQCGGQQPAFNQQQPLQPTFGNPINSFKPYTAPTSMPSFAGISSNNINNTNNNSIFGQNQPVAQNAFGQNTGAPLNNSIFGQALGTQNNQQPQNNSIFGQNISPLGQTQNTSIFGQNQNNSVFGQNQNNSVFGQNATTFGQNQNTSVFGQPQNNSIFGQNQNTSIFGQPQNTSIFGQTQQNATSFLTPGANQGNSLFPSFGNNNGSMFGNQVAQQGTSLFNQDPNFLNQPTPTNSFYGQTSPTPSLFGQQPQGSLFGGSQQLPSILFQTPAQPPLFGGVQANPLFPSVQLNVQPASQLGFFNQPGSLYNTTPQPLAQLPLTEASLQQMLPYLILSALLKQPNNQDMVKRLQTILTVASSASPAKQQKLSSYESKPYLSAPDPFEEYVRNAKRQLQKQQNKISLFSDYERKHGIRRQYVPDFPMQPPKQKVLTVKDIRFVKPEFLDNYQQPKKIPKKQGYRKKKPQSNIPNIADFSIFPHIDVLKLLSNEELRKVDHVRVWNKYGQVEFLQPISLQNLNFKDIFVISQDKIELQHEEIQAKSKRMTFNNFGKYTTLKDTQKESMLKKMRKWIASHELIEISHDKRTGDLVVETV